MKSTQSLITLAILSGVVSTSAFAADITRADVQSDLQAYQQSGLASLERGEATVDTNSVAYKVAEQRYEALRGDKVQTQSVSRAAVEADLQAYQQSGLAGLERGEATVDTNSAAYQAAEQRYEALRGAKVQTQAVSRAAVEADLQAYQQSGLAEMNAGNRNVDELSPRYQQALSKYNQLRSQL